MRSYRSRKIPMPRFHFFAFALLALPLLTGCPPTLSQSANEGYDRKLAEASRHARAGRYEVASESYAEASRLASRRVDQDEARYRQARTLMRAGSFEEAVAILDKIGDRKPTSRRTARAVYDAARVRYEYLENYERAREGFDRVIRDYPDAGLGHRAIYFRIADFKRQDREDAIIPYLDALYEASGETTLGDDILMERAKIYEARGDRENEKLSLAKLVRNHPYPSGHLWDEALLRLSELFIEDGEIEAAIDALERIVAQRETTTLIGSYTRSSMPLALYRIGLLYRDEVRDIERAEQAFERFRRLFPDSTLADDVLYERGAMWLDEGEARRGCGHLKALLDEYPVGRARRAGAARYESECTEG